MSEQDELHTEPPESFGEFLKRHREASGKTLEEIARVTRISKRYLDAFEANDEHNMPEDAFARGFLKNYAHEVGMDVDECISRYEQFKKSTAPTQIREMQAKKRLASTEVESSHTGLWVVGAAVLAFVAIALWFAFTQMPTEDQQASSGIDVETPDSDADVDKKADVLRSGVPPSIFEVTATGNSTLIVRVDEFAEQEILLETGQTRKFEVYRKVEVRDPNAEEAAAFKDVSFKINGRPMAKPQSGRLNALNQYIISSDDFGPTGR